MGFEGPFIEPAELFDQILEKQEMEISEKGNEGIQLLYRIHPFSTKGVITTDIKQPRPPVSLLSKGGCVGYWTAFIRAGRVVAARCFESYPRWMWENRKLLGDRSLRSLVIPGSHNSGSFVNNDTTDAVDNWVVCQGEDVLTQLLYGIRYLDLRVAYYPDTPELLWINHDHVKWRPLSEVLSDIKGFAGLSPDPIIVDVHRTPVGFDNPEAVHLLVSLVNTSIGSLLLPSHYGVNAPLHEIWATGKTVIFSYGNYALRRHIPWLWPPIKQSWANAQVLPDLKKYLDKEMGVNHQWPWFWAAMGHLSPSMWDILIQVHKGLRNMADRTGRKITDWLKYEWASKANIVCTDFFHVNDVIYAAVKINQARVVCPSAVESIRITTTTSSSSTPASEALLDVERRALPNAVDNGVYEVIPAGINNRNDEIFREGLEETDKNVETLTDTFLSTADEQKIEAELTHPLMDGPEDLSEVNSYQGELESTSMELKGTAGPFGSWKNPWMQLLWDVSDFISGGGNESHTAQNETYYPERDGSWK